MTVFGPEDLRDPQAVSLAREISAVHPAKVGDMRVWMVVRDAEARKALHDDTRLLKDREGLATAMNRQLTASGHSVTMAETPITFAHMLFADGPEHARLRRMVAPPFNARVDAMGPRVEAITRALLDSLDRPHDGGPIDLVARFAVPLSMTVLCDLVGVPEQDRAPLPGWTAAMMQDFNPAVAEPAAEAMTEYLAGLIASKRAAPTDDLLSDLLAAGDDGDRLTDDEVLGTLVLLIVPGHEATAAMIGNGVAALLGRHPELWREMAEDAEKIPGIVEELLRLEGSSLNATYRYTAEDVTIGDTVIPAGEVVLIALGSANRDRYPDGDAVCPVGPGQSDHVAFGAGPHQCFGADLARMEIGTGMGLLSARFRGAELAVPLAELERNDHPIFSGHHAVPVLLRP